MDVGPTPVDNPREAHHYFLNAGGGITAVVIILTMAAIAVTVLMTMYAKQYYNTISSGQDKICNFYTCSVEDDECGFYPFTVDLEGNKICLQE